MILFDGSKRLYKGNLHCHTTVSDGKKSPEEVMEIYKDAGYDFLTITDHRKFARPLRYDGSFTVLPGVEFDFDLPGEVIHIVGVGITEEMVAHHRKEAGPQQAIDEINACGGFAVLAHPAWSLNKVSTMISLHGIGGCEVFNTTCGLPWHADRSDSSVLLEQCSTLGHHFRFVADDDSHPYIGEQCKGWNMVAAKDNTMESLLEALKNGSFYASCGPDIKLFEREGNEFHIVCSPVSTILFSSNDVHLRKRLMVGEGLTEMWYTACPSETYVRVTLIDENGKRAWTSPVSIL